MLFHHFPDPQSGADIEQLIIEYREELDPEALEKAWQIEVKRHSALRTGFHRGRNGEPFQEVDDGATVTIGRIGPPFSTGIYRRYLDEDRLRGFDLDRPPLMRLMLFSMAGDRLVETAPGA